MGDHSARIETMRAELHARRAELVAELADVDNALRALEPTPDVRRRAPAANWPTVVRAAFERERRPLRPADVIAALPDARVSTLRAAVNQLLRAGELERVARGVYRLARTTTEGS